MLAWGTVKVGVNFLTGGGAGDLLDEGKKIATEGRKHPLEERLEAVLNQEEYLEKFREALEEIAGAPWSSASSDEDERPDGGGDGAPTEAAAGEGKSAPDEQEWKTDEEKEGDDYLIVIIDDLDRCRPDFALKVLELLKHVFHAERVCFLLVSDMGKLCSVIRHTYGHDFDPDAYLMKFYDLRISFPLSGNAPIYGNTESDNKVYESYFFNILHDYAKIYF